MFDLLVFLLVDRYNLLVYCQVLVLVDFLLLLFLLLDYYIHFDYVLLHRLLMIDLL